MWTNVEEEGAYSHTLHTEGEKVCNLHVNGGMISQKLYHTQAYHCFCVKLIKVAYLKQNRQKSQKG